MGFRVAVLGMGLIGGSIGLALKDSPLVETLSGYDQDADTVKQAMSIGAIGRSGVLEEVVRDADFIFICVPLRSMSALVNQIAPWLKPGCIVTDVGSVKTPVLEWMRGLPDTVHAVGGHPMAGSEKTGINSADRYLFENALYVLTPFADTPPEIIQRLTRLLEEAGARVKVLNAEAHDQAVAMVSHLPHVVAYALLGLVEGSPEGVLMAAGSFRDLTRVASSSLQLWEDILLSNREEVAESISRLVAKLESLRSDLLHGDRDALAGWINSAQRVREAIPHQKKGLLPESHEIITVVPDRPGVIGQLGQWLGGQGINIVDIEILRVREGDGGTIRLGVPTGDAAERAVEVLRGKGVRAWRR